MLQESAIKEFKELYKKEFQIELTNEEAYQKANNLLNLYKVVYSKLSNIQTKVSGQESN